MELDRSKLRLAPLSTRQHDLHLDAMLPLRQTEEVDERLQKVGLRLIRAREQGAARVLMMGAHLLRCGVQPYLNDLLRSGLISCVAMNGAGVIHDYELALIGATTESVARYIRQGEFGLWEETSRINDIVSAAAGAGLGLGEAVGRAIAQGDFPHRQHSLLATAWSLGIPVTVHVGIGYDIVYEMPNCDGAAYGATSYRDFLRFAAVLQGLEGGVVMNFGSAVMAPEVYLKALSMARNLAAQKGGQICNFSTLVCDLMELPEDFRQEPPRGSAAYYFRPWKTMLVRTLADGGESFYVRGSHAQTIPQLWTACRRP